MERVKVVITNDQKKVKVPTGIRLLIRRCCHAVLELENFEGSARFPFALSITRKSGALTPNTEI